MANESYNSKFKLIFLKRRRGFERIFAFLICKKNYKIGGKVMTETYLVEVIIQVIINTAQLWWELAKEYPLGTLLFIIIWFLPTRKRRFK